MIRGLRWLIALAVGAVALAVAVGAGAHGSGLPPTAIPWVAEYSLTVDGTQHGTWTEHHAAVPPCDGGETGSGTEDVTLTSDGSTPVFASGVGPTLTSVLVAAAADIPVPDDPNSVPQMVINTSAQITREGSVTDGTPADPTQCPSGGGGDAGPPPTPDCGGKTGSLELFFDQSSNLLQFEQPDGSAPDDPYTDCPYLGNDVYPLFTPVNIPLPPSGWGPPPPIGTAIGLNPIEFTGEGNSNTSDADVDASSTEQLKLRFTPVYVQPTIILGDVGHETVGSDGSMSVPVTCPPGEKGGCSGSVALAIDVAAASRAGALATPPMPTLAKVNFKLAAGAKQKLKLKLGHPSKSYFKAIAQTPLVFVVSIGSHRIRYVASKTTLRFR